MKTRIFGAGPIGRWLAFRLGQSGQDVDLLVRTLDPDLHEMAKEFAELNDNAGMETPNLDALLECLP